MNKIMDGDITNLAQKIQDKKESIKVTTTRVAPAGYLPISLSSEGNFGVPKTIWIKNFTTEDALALAMAQETLLPEYLIPILNENIWNPDKVINVSEWTEKQIVELLLKVYANFYSPIIQDIILPLNEEDDEYLNKPENSDLKESIANGYAPKVDIDIRKLNFYDLTTIRVSDKIRIKKGTPKLDIVFSIPRFGDILILKNKIEEFFFELDKTYKVLQNRVDNDDVTLTLMDIASLQKYYLDKASYTTRITKAYYLQEVDGVDISSKTLLEKMEVLKNDARFDKLLFDKYEKELRKFQYGVDENVPIVHPLTKVPCVRRFTFRPFNILQIILLSEFDDYDISYD